MNWPTSQDFNEAIQNPGCLTDPVLKSGQVVTNAMGLPVPRSGNFADVYQFKGGDGMMWAVKLFTRKVPGLQERYARIDAHLAKAQFPFAVGFQFLQQGIRIKGQFFPLLKMEWVEGFTLNDFVAENVSKPHYLHALVQMWAKLCGRLRDANFAHADLQHGNVLLVPGATPQKLGLKLIDYDGMWVPALAESHSGEVGHPNFQHPLRLKERLYNADVDRFPHLVIAAALRGTMLGGKALWDKFDNADNLLFKEQDLRDPASAPVFKALWNLDDPVLRTLVGHVVLNVKQPLRKTPWLDDVLFEEGGPRLSGEQERQVCDILGVQPVTKVAVASAVPAAQEEFNVFRFMDDDTPSPVQEKKLSGARPTPQKKKSKKPETDEEPRKSKTPLLIGGGVLALGLIGAVIALTAGSNKEPTHPEIVKHDPEKEKNEPDPIRKKDKEAGELVVTPKKNTDPVVPPPGAPRGAIFGVAPLGSGQDYLFIRRDDPALYATEGGSSRRARELGRHLGPIRALVSARDGSRVLTGGEDGEVRIWSLAEPKTPALDPSGKRPTLTKNLTATRDLKVFGIEGDFALTPNQEGVLVRDNKSGKEEFVAAVQPGIHEAEGPFKEPYNNDRAKKDFGPPMSAHARLFDGAIDLQVFQGGIMVLGKDGKGKMFGSHEYRTLPIADGGGRAALKRRIAAFAKIQHFDGRYDFEAFQEGGLFREVSSGKEAVVLAGKPGHEVKAGFKWNLDNIAKLPEELGEALSDETKILDGVLVVQLFEGGAQFFEPNSKKSTWFARHPKRKPTTDVAPAKGSKPLKEKITGPSKTSGLKKEYEYTLYREGLHIRDITANKEATIPAGRPVPATDPAFKGDFDYNRLVKIWKEPVSVPTEIFDGELTVVVCRRGFYMKVNGTPQSWNLTVAPNQLVGEADDSAPGELRRIIHSYAKILPFQGDYRFEGYEEGVRIRDNAANKEATVFAGRPGGHVIKGPFKATIESDKRAEKFGEVLTGEESIFNGALVVQIFEGGVIVWEKASDKAWPTVYSRPKAPAPAPAPNPAPPPQIASSAPKVLKEHAKPVIALAISLDGAHAVSIGEDNLLCEWNLIEGKLVRKFSVPDALSVAYLPDAKAVIVGTKTGAVGLWELAKQERIKELTGHSAAIRAACVSPKGDMAFTGGDDGTVRIWALPEGTSRSLSFDKGGVSALALSPDGNSLAMSSPEGLVRIVDPRSGQIQRNYPSNRPFHSLAFLGNGQRVVAAAEPEPMFFLATPEAVVQPKSKSFTLLHEGDPLAEGPGRIACSRDGKLLHYQQKGSIVIADAATGKEVGRLPIEGQTRDVELGPDKKIYISTTNATFQIWDWDKREMLKEFDFREQKQPPVATIHPTPDPNRLFLLTSSPFALWWDVATWKPTERFVPFPNEACIKGTLYPDGKQILIELRALGAGGGTRLAVWDLANKRAGVALERVEVKNLFSVEISPNGKWIVGATSENGGQAFIWDAKTGKLHKTLMCLRTPGMRGGFTAGGDYFVFFEPTARRLALVDLEKDQVVEQFQPRVMIQTLVVHSPANLLATVDSDRRLRIWRIEMDKAVGSVSPPDPTPIENPVEKGGLLHTSESLSGVITGLAISGDGKKVFASTQTGNVHVLDAGNMKEIMTFAVGKAAIRGMVLLPKNVSLSGTSSPERLFLLDEERHVRVIDTEKGTAIRDIDLQKVVPKVSLTNYIAVSPREETLMIFEVAKPGGVAWDLKRGALGAPAVLKREPFASSTSSVAYAPDGSQGAAIADRKLLIWNERIGKEIRTIEGIEPNLRLVGFVPDAKAVVATTVRDRMIAWDITSGKELFNLAEPHGAKQFIAPAVFPERAGIVTAGADRTFRVWDARSGRVIVKWPMQHPPSSALVSPDGRRAVVAHGGVKKVSVWAIPEVGAKKP